MTPARAQRAEGLPLRGSVAGIRSPATDEMAEGWGMKNPPALELESEEALLLLLLKVQKEPASPVCRKGSPLAGLRH